MYYCNICDYYTVFRNSYDIHLTTLKHRDVVREREYFESHTYKCYMCSYATNRLNSWLQHQKAKYHIEGTGIRH